MQTATNPDTGEKLILREGEWVPMPKTATNPETGEKLVLEGGEWKPIKAGSPFGGAYAALQGAADLPHNLVRLLTNLGTDEEAKERMGELHREREQHIEETTGDRSDLWRLGGSVLASGGLAGAPAATGRTMLGRAAERIGNAAAEGGLFGAMSPDLDVRTGAGAGAGIAGAVEGLGAAGRGIKGLPGVGGRALSKLLPMSEDARKADAFAKEKGVPIAGEDLVQNQIVRSTGRLVDAADPTNFRNRQLASYAETFKKDIVDPFTEFDDPISEMGASFQRQYDAVKERKNQLYDAAFKELNPLGPMPATGFRDSLVDMKARYSQLLGENTPEVREINKWLEYGDANVEDWVTRRKKLGRDIRKTQRATDTDTVDLEVMNQIRDELDASIDQFAGQNSTYRKANEFYRQNVVPYKEDAFKRLLQKGDLEKMTKDALSEAPTARTEKRFQQVWSSLDESGRQAYRQQLLQSIMDRASNPETGFSPNAAATGMDRLKNRLGENVLGPELTKAMDGWNNLFRQSGFSAETVARSRTGSSVPQMTGPFLAAGAGAINPALLAPLLPGLLVRSRKVRNVLAKLADMEPKHPDYNRVVQDFMETVSQEAARIQALTE